MAKRNSNTWLIVGAIVVMMMLGMLFLLLVGGIALWLWLTPVAI